MFSKLFFVTFALFVLGTFGQVFEDKVTLDLFTAETDEPLFILTPATGDFGPIEETAFTTGSTILGGERDISLTALRGNNLIFSSSVNSDAWIVSTPNEGNGFAYLQYDGVDGTIDLDENGLDGANFLENFSFAFRLEFTVDIDTRLSLVTYAGGQTCEAELDLEGTRSNPELQEAIIGYAEFDGNCDFANVGAFEIYVQAFDNVDFSLSTLVTFGEVPPTPSNTPSNTRTPSPAAVPSRSPSSTPSPSPIEINLCECDCPAFHCGLVYAVPGDDDDTVDDDAHDDDDIVYRPVYFGPVDDDFNYIYGDDDEHELISREGGLTINHNDDDDDTTTSTSSILSVTIALIVLVTFSMF